MLLKEVIDNSIDEFKMGAGKRIEVDIQDNLRVSIRDYGRGIPLGKLVEAVSMLNTGGKYDSKAFQKSVGLNGVGLKAVNALSTRFEVQSFRDGQTRRAAFSKGILESNQEMCFPQALVVFVGSIIASVAGWAILRMLVNISNKVTQISEVMKRS